MHQYPSAAPIYGGGGFAILAFVLQFKLLAFILQHGLGRKAQPRVDSWRGVIGALVGSMPCQRRSSS